MSEKRPVLIPPPSLPEAQKEETASMQRWNVCPRCGSEDVGGGYLIDYGDKFTNVYLAPLRLKLSKLRNLWRPYRHLIKVYADVCRNCGMVVLEVDTDEFVAAEQRFGRS